MIQLFSKIETSLKSQIIPTAYLNSPLSIFKTVASSFIFFSVTRCCHSSLKINHSCIFRLQQQEQCLAINQIHATQGIATSTIQGTPSTFHFFLPLIQDWEQNYKGKNESIHSYLDLIDSCCSSVPHAKPVVAGLMATRGKQDLPSARSGRASATREEARGGGWRAATARFLCPVKSTEQTAWYFGTAHRTAVGPLFYVKLSKFRLDKPNSFSLGVAQRADIAKLVSIFT